MVKRILITGAAGFVGHHIVESVLKNTDWNIIVLDRLDYASNGLDRLRDIKCFDENRVTFYSWDLQMPISENLEKEIGHVDYILHMAAGSHVDDSIANPVPFIKNNIDNALTMLEYARKIKPEKYIYFSTDEVYSTAPETGPGYKEGDRFNPGNPYSSSKASAECITMAYANTYRIPCIITNTMNCFTGDTKISLLNGTVEEIKNLVGKESFWVYSYDLEKNKINIGKGHSCHLTQEKAPIYSVILDNDELIKCTPTHLFLMRNGKYQKVEDLKVGDSLMPLYKMLGDNKYEQVWHPELEKWEKTHNLTYEYKYGPRQKGMLAHHINFNKYDNTPENILSMGFKEHFMYHSKNTTEHMHALSVRGVHIFQNLSKKSLLKRAATKKERGQYIELANEAIKHNKLPESRINISSVQKQSYIDNPGRINTSLKNLEKANIPEIKQKIADIKREHGYWEKWSKKLKKNNPMSTPEAIQKMIATRRQRGSYKTPANNHRIKEINFLGYEDVYDFTVDGNHNFALAAGVFVHNCIGERQHPQKYLPKVINSVLDGKTLEIHANADLTQAGRRHYIHSRNVGDAILFILNNTNETLDKLDASKGKFNIVGEKEYDNLAFAQLITEKINKVLGTKYELKYKMVSFHAERPGHDLVYKLDGTKMKNLGWTPPKTIEESIENLVRWTLQPENIHWLGRTKI